MPKGNGKRGSGSVSDYFNFEYDFKLHSLNCADEERTPTSATTKAPSNKNEIEITTYTFSKAIENFTGSYEAYLGWVGYGVLEYDGVEIIRPLKLDLTARYLPAGTTLTLLDGRTTLNISDSEITVEKDRIEYVFNSPELKQRGIYELALYVEDQDQGKEGFQLNGRLIDPTKAISSINSILDVFDLSTQDAVNARVSVASKTDKNKILSKETYLSASAFEKLQEPTVLVQAEDLSLDTYLVEDFSKIKTNDGSKTANESGISLSDAGAKVGVASLLASDHSLSGIYDLSISYFDENDGEAQIQVLINNAIVGKRLLDENTSSGLPTEDTRREFVIEDLLIKPTDTIAIKGIANNSEWARIDFIAFYVDTEITFDKR